MSPGKKIKMDGGHQYTKRSKGSARLKRILYYANGKGRRVSVKPAKGEIYNTSVKGADRAYNVTTDGRNDMQMREQEVPWMRRIWREIEGSVLTHPYVLQPRRRR